MEEGIKWYTQTASPLCWEKLGGICSKLEGKGNCIGCVLMDEIMSPCIMKFDTHAHESLEELIAFLIRVNAVWNRGD